MLNNYNELSRDELIETCKIKDEIIAEIKKQLQNNCKLFCKNDIMSMYQCENNKALRILKVLFDMGYANKVGKEYVVSPKAHEEFLECMAGKEVFI